MMPYISIFGFNISSYAVCVITGIAVACILVGIKTRNDKGVNHRTQLVNIPIVAAFGAFFGAHILYGITHLDHLWWVLCHSDKAFESWESTAFYFSDIFGGMVFYGGLIGGIIVGTIYCKHMKLDTLFYADIYAPAIPLFHAFGRIGCFLGGCCYGIESRFGFTYTNSLTPEANNVCRFPIQLFEAGGDILICIILLILSNKKLLKGMLMYMYLFMYSVLRFITEFFRGDEIRGFLFGVSTSQWISIAIFIISVILIYRLYRNNIKKHTEVKTKSKAI